MKRLAAIVTLVPLLLGAMSTEPWYDVCADPTLRANVFTYCDDVGKTGWESQYLHSKIGEILGVAWRPKGSLINTPEYYDSLIGKEAIERLPALATPYRTSPRNAYYYIINTKGDEERGAPPFLRMCREIDAR